ncbi:MAG: amidase family protein [Cellulosilyticaceae bacterium]
MKKAIIIILSVIGVGGLVVALNYKGILRMVSGKFNDSFVATQVKQQYDEEKKTTSKVKVDIEQFRASLNAMDSNRYNEVEKLVVDATIDDIQQAIGDKKLSYEELVTYYLKRIEKHDINKLNTIIELNPDAIKIAKERDAKPVQGKLYGIPILLKDNIATGDKMHNRAGAAALKDAIPEKASFIAEKLKAEGAIILGKANMSEWANYMTTTSSNGYSALGGQTHNPYGKYDVGGSSSGSAAATAAGFATICIGSETAGSMIYPSSQNSVVGLKPSIGVLSRHGIIPITKAQDTAGVMAKHVQDVEIVTDVIADVDSKDSETQDVEKYRENTFDLKDNSLKDVKVAVVALQMPRKEEQKILKRVQEELENMGAKIIKTSFNQDDTTKLKLDVAQRTGFKFELDQYLKENPVENIKSLNDIIAFNNVDAANRAPFGQTLLEDAAKDTTTMEMWEKVVATNRSIAGKMIDDVLKDADVIVSLSNHTSAVYAGAGYPALTVPAGYKTTGEPIGVTFVGSKYQDKRLLKIAGAYEKATAHRQDPTLQ